MAVLSMSKQEFSRLDVLLRVQSGRLRAGMTGCLRVQPRGEWPSSAACCADVGLEKAFSSQDEIVN